MATTSIYKNTSTTRPTGLRNGFRGFTCLVSTSRWNLEWPRESKIDEKIKNMKGYMWVEKKIRG